MDDVKENEVNKNTERSRQVLSLSRFVLSLRSCVNFDDPFVTNTVNSSNNTNNAANELVAIQPVVGENETSQSLIFDGRRCGNDDGFAVTCLCTLVVGASSHDDKHNSPPCRRLEGHKNRQ